MKSNLQKTFRQASGNFRQRAKAANPDIKIIETMTGTTPEAWNNQTKGAEITKSQVDQGSDVVFQAAGGTGIAVLQTAADSGILGIGVDSNQNARDRARGRIHIRAEDMACAFEPPTHGRAWLLDA